MPDERYTIQTPTGEEEHSAGGVVYRRAASGAVEVLLIERKRRHDWGWPKGHLEPGESVEAAAVREIAEETGIAGEIVAPLDTVRYPITGRSGRPTTKVVTYFLVAARDPAAEPTPQPGETDSVRWLSLDAAAARLTWPEDHAILARAIAALTSSPTG